MDTNTKMCALIIILFSITIWIFMVWCTINDVMDWIDDWVRLIHGDGEDDHED
jgi:hypothetical protein